MTVSSGTAALHLACLAAGIGPGDEVIVPAFTFVASAAAARYVGADAGALRRRSARTTSTSTRQDVDRAHHAAHARGHRRALLRLSRATSRRCGRSATSTGSLLIEDCAQAIGAARRRRRARSGTVGELGAFSFFSKKQLCVGEGGMVATADEDARRDACGCCARTP